jgi:hypothetical protein
MITSTLSLHNDDTKNLTAGRVLFPDSSMLEKNENSSDYSSVDPRA